MTALKRLAFVFFALLILIPNESFSAELTYVDPSALSSDAFDKCKQRIMTAGSEDFKSFSPNRIVEDCQSFPLADDIFVQIIGALVGPEFVNILDSYTALTGEAHGFDPASTLFIVAMPMHEVFYAYNYLMLSILIFFISLSIAFQVYKWASGDFKLGLKEFTSKKLLNYAIITTLSTPIFGWMTLIQAFGLLVIVMLGYVAKLSVTYLFLASFFANAALEIKEELNLNVKSDFGSTIYLYQCDLSRREGVISVVQNSLGTKDVSQLKSNPIYSCLTSGTPSSEIRELLDNGEDSGISFSVIPAPLVSTEKCLTQYEPELRKMGYEKADACGYAEFKIPRNTAYPESVERAISLYMNEDINKGQRELALLFHEYECRTGDIKVENNEIITRCLIPKISGSNYVYGEKEDPITEVVNLNSYSTRLTEASLDLFLSDLKSKMEKLQNSVLADSSKLMNHLTDLIAPTVDESDLPQGLKDKLARARESIAKSSSDDASSLGFSEEDASYLVNNIKRGVWTSSSLFFDGLTDDLDDEIVVSAMRDTYSVKTGSWIDAKLSAAFEYASHYSVPSVASLLSLMSMDSVVSSSSVESSVSTGDTLLSGYIIPRLGVYTDNIGCWFKQSECVTPPLNPFRSLGKRGSDLIDESLSRIIGIKFLSAMVNTFLDVPVLNEKIPGYQKFMILETLGDMVFIYFLIGIILAIVIPLIPFLKLMVMMINWGMDILRELLSLQAKIVISVVSNHGRGVLADDVVESFRRIIGLGLYFLFILLGVLVMFLMFSFLYSINIFLVGALSSVVSWGGDPTVVETMVINVIMDLIITFVLVYEVIKCTPFIEKIPKSMAEQFGIKLTNSDAVVNQMYEFMKHRVPSFLADSFIRH